MSTYYIKRKEPAYIYAKRVPYSNELYHFGVKGMKWGVRKEREPIGTRLKRRARGQLQSAQKYGKKHSSAGIVARQFGKTVAQTMAISMAAIPVAALTGGAAVPLISLGASFLAANNMAKAGTSLYYKHQKSIHNAAKTLKNPN